VLFYFLALSTTTKKPLVNALHKGIRTAHTRMIVSLRMIPVLNVLEKQHRIIQKKKAASPEP